MTTACEVSIRRKRNDYIIKKTNFFFLAALRIEQGLKDVDVVEEEEVNFEVQLTKHDSRGKWLKDGKVLYPDQK
jgi:hypothetical protein